MVDRVTRYTVSAISYIFLGIFFLILFSRVYKINFSYSIGLLFLSLGFFVKALADRWYAVTGDPFRPKFHLFTAIYFLIAGLTILYYRYFGSFWSTFFAILFLIFAYTEYLHVRQLEEPLYKAKRQFLSMLIKWFIGSMIFFDALFYNFVNPTMFGWIFTIYGVIAGVYILYASLVIYEYMKESTGYGLKEVLLG